MESIESKYMKKLIEELLEEKFEIKNHIDKLNRHFKKREQSLDELKEFYYDLQNSNQLRQEKEELDEN